jgi:hypothetical protein
MLKATKMGLWGCTGWEWYSSLPFFRVGGIILISLAILVLIRMILKKQLPAINLLAKTYSFSMICVSIPLILFGSGKWCNVAAIFFIYDLYILPLISFIGLRIAFRKMKQERDINLDQNARKELDKYLVYLRDPSGLIIICWMILIVYTFFFK